MPNKPQILDQAYLSVNAAANQSKETLVSQKHTHTHTRTHASIHTTVERHIISHVILVSDCNASLFSLFLILNYVKITILRYTSVKYYLVKVKIYLQNKC